MAVLIGFAGTGKTWLISRLVQSLQLLGEKQLIAMSAPTHKAVKELKKHPINGVDYATIHSLLGLKEKRNEFTGQITFEPVKSKNGEPPPISDYTTLILDEVSMFGSVLFNYLVPWISAGLKVIFCGDKVQIPPVNEAESYVLQNAQFFNMDVFELTIPMRQKDGNPILEFATEIRTDYIAGSFYPKEHWTEAGGIQLIEAGNADMEDTILETYFTSPEFQKNTDYMKVIAWRNNTVDIYNRRIREYLYKDSIEPLKSIMLKEKLIMDKPFIDINTGRILLTTNEEIEVINMKEIWEEISYKDAAGSKHTEQIKVYVLTVSWSSLYKNQVSTKSTQIKVVHEDSEELYQGFLSLIKKEVQFSSSTARGFLWRSFFKIDDSYAKVKYNYAITAHKSQGSTYDNALVLKWDIDVNGASERDATKKGIKIKERNRILYVACTRARHTLFIEP